MKRIISWVVVMLLVLMLSIVLFVTGKKHKILLINGNKGQEVPKKVYYIVDGENKNKPKNIKANKKGVVFVKGSSHKIVLQFKDLNGNKKEIKKDFKIPVSSEAVINFYNLINNEETWIKYRGRNKKKSD